MAWPEAIAVKKIGAGIRVQNACVRSFVYECGGYSSGLSLYEFMRKRLDE